MKRALLIGFMAAWVAAPGSAPVTVADDKGVPVILASAAIPLAQDGQVALEGPAPIPSSQPMIKELPLPESATHPTDTYQIIVDDLAPSESGDLSGTVTILFTPEM